MQQSCGGIEYIKGQSRYPAKYEKTNTYKQMSI